MDSHHPRAQFSKSMTGTSDTHKNKTWSKNKISRCRKRNRTNLKNKAKSTFNLQLMCRKTANWMSQLPLITEHKVLVRDRRNRTIIRNILLQKKKTTTRDGSLYHSNTIAAKKVISSTVVSSTVRRRELWASRVDEMAKTHRSPNPNFHKP